MRFCLFGLLMVLFFSPCLASDNTTLVVFSRHTFRGISTKVAPQKIFLREFGINVPIPNLSYGENATPRGLMIAENFAAPALQEAAALAVGAIAENKVFDGHWDEVRAELATERTFWTGLYLIKGIKEQDAEHNRAIQVHRMQDRSGKGCGRCEQRPSHQGVHLYRRCFQGRFIFTFLKPRRICRS